MLSLMSWTVTEMLIVLSSGSPGGLKLAVTVTMIVGLSLSAAESRSILFAVVTSPVFTHK